MIVMETDIGTFPLCFQKVFFPLKLTSCDERKEVYRCHLNKGNLQLLYLLNTFRLLSRLNISKKYKANFDHSTAAATIPMNDSASSHKSLKSGLSKLTQVFRSASLKIYHFLGKFHGLKSFSTSKSSPSQHKFIFKL